jgi:hypothetical protein
VTNIKLALTDDKFTYEPSYNLVKKAPSLAVSRPVGAGKYKVRAGRRRRRDDMSVSVNSNYGLFVQSSLYAVAIRGGGGWWRGTQLCWWLGVTDRWQLWSGGD